MMLPVQSEKLNSTEDSVAGFLSVGVHMCWVLHQSLQDKYNAEQHSPFSFSESRFT